MAMFNDLFELLAGVPPMLVVAWLAWLGTGALIVMWFRRAALEQPMPAAPPRAVSKPKPVSRPASSPDLHATETPVDAHATGDAPVSGRTKAPVVIGDPFGDLATLLDQPSAPADSPILSSSGSPVRRTHTD